MTTSRSKVQQFILYALLPVVCSIVIGYVFNRENVFEPHYAAFQFVWSAFVASLFFYLLIFLRSRDAFLGLILLYVLTVLTTRSTQLVFLLRDLVYVGAIGLSIFLYFKYFRQDAVANYAYTPFMLAGIYSVVNIVSTEILLGIHRTFGVDDIRGDILNVASTSAVFGVLIGFAVGCGISLNERLWAKKKIISHAAAT